MTTICLVRHGETDWNAAGRLQGQEDTPLNEAGREQARRAGAYLAQWTWDYLFASTLSRARDTATLIGEAINLPLHATLPDFVERDYGEGSGYTPAENAARFPDNNIPGVEPRPDLERRVMAGLETLALTYPGKRLIVVAHGGVINAMLKVMTDGEIGSGKTQLANACISLIHHRGEAHGEDRGEAWEIEYYNYRDHLPEDPRHPLTAHIGVN